MVESCQDTYRDIGGRATHDCMDAGGRMNQETESRKPKPNEDRATIENRVWKREACTPQGGIEKNPWGTVVEKSHISQEYAGIS